MNIIKATPTRHSYVGCVWWVCMMDVALWACLVGVALGNSRLVIS